MKKKILDFLAVSIIVNLMGCTNTQQTVPNSSKTDTTSTQTVANEPDRSKQKITPSLWVDKDAKAVADYYLSIFKDGKLKEYHQYKNPP